LAWKPRSGFHARRGALLTCAFSKRTFLETETTEFPAMDFALIPAQVLSTRLSVDAVSQEAPERYFFAGDGLDRAGVPANLTCPTMIGLVGLIGSQQGIREHRANPYSWSMNRMDKKRGPAYPAKACKNGYRLLAQPAVHPAERWFHLIKPLATCPRISLLNEANDVGVDVLRLFSDVAHRRLEGLIGRKQVDFGIRVSHAECDGEDLLGRGFHEDLAKVGNADGDCASVQNEPLQSIRPSFGAVAHSLPQTGAPAVDC